MQAQESYQETSYWQFDHQQTQLCTEQINIHISFKLGLKTSHYNKSLRQNIARRFWWRRLQLNRWRSDKVDVKSHNTPRTNVRCRLAFCLWEQKGRWSSLALVGKYYPKRERISELKKKLSSMVDVVYWANSQLTKKIPRYRNRKQNKTFFSVFWKIWGSTKQTYNALQPNAKETIEPTANNPGSSKNTLIRNPKAIITEKVCFLSIGIMKTLIEPGNLARAAKYTRIYKLDVMGLCEVRCNFFRYEMLRTGEKNCFLKINIMQMNLV